MIGKQVPKIILLSIAFALLFAVVIYFLPDIFRAESLILVEQQKIPEKLVESTVQVDLGDRLATISQQILSATQLQKIIEKHGLYRNERGKSTPEELVEKMRSDIEIKTEKGWARNRPGAFRVFFKGPDAQQAAAVANEISNLFIEENMKSREVQASGATEFLSSQLEEARKRLLDQEAKLSEFKKKNSGQLPGQENGIIMALTNLQTQAVANNDSLARAQGNKSMIETDLRAAESGLQRILEAMAADAAAAARAKTAAATAAANNNGVPPGDPAVPRPKTRSEELEALLDQMRRRYTEQHPQVRAVRAELERVRIQEAREREAALAARRPAQQQQQQAGGGQRDPEPPSAISAQNTVLVEQQRERVEKLKAQLVIANQEITAREQEKSRIEAELGRYQATLAKLPVNEQEMISVTRDYEVSKKAYDTLLQKSYTANTAEDLERRQKSERFTVLDVARAPEKPFQPNRPLLYALGVVLAIGIGIIGGVAIEFRKNVVLGEWELPPDVWLLGRIPIIELDPENPGGGVKKKDRRKSNRESILQPSATSGD
jgi:polysaccharide chain length determinant protein (PEP-CTERM system associated)